MHYFQTPRFEGASLRKRRRLRRLRLLRSQLWPGDQPVSLFRRAPYSCPTVAKDDKITLWLHCEACRAATEIFFKTERKKKLTFRWTMSLNKACLMNKIHSRFHVILIKAFQYYLLLFDVCISFVNAIICFCLLSFLVQAKIGNNVMYMLRKSQSAFCLGTLHETIQIHTRYQKFQ